VEVLSPTTEAQDRGPKFQFYARYKIPHYWLVDPEARHLDVYELAGADYCLTATLAGAADFAPPLFPGLAFPLGSLWPR
jgi:Uma2 family endonuclease